MALSAPKQMEQGDMLAPKDIEGHTLLIIPIEFIPSIKTEFDKGDETSKAIKCNVADFAADPHNPTVYRGVLFFNVSLYNNLRKQIGESVAGRLYKGQAKPGQSAPWLLQDVTVEPEWTKFLIAWLDNTPAGAEFQAEAQAAILEASSVAAPATTAPAVPAAPPAPPAPAAPPAPSFPTAPAAVAPPAPAPVAAPAPAAPAGNPAPAGAPDFASMLAHLPVEEQQRMLALMAQQGQASS